MREQKLVICDRNEKYLQAMQEYLLKRRLGSFQIQCFTDVEQMLQSSKKETFAILLLSEELYQEQKLEQVAQRIYILDEGMGKEIAYPYLSKYQSMEQLIQRLFEDYMLQDTVKSKPFLGKRARILSFYTPQSLSLQTLCALAAGQVLAETRKVLYLNLQAFAGFETLCHTQYDTDFTDFIYFIRKHPEKIQYKLESMKRKMGALDYIAPANDYQDLLTLSKQDWQEVLELLETQTEYETIILDVSGCCAGLYEVLEKSHRIYMPRSKSVLAEAGKKQYEALLFRKEKQDILAKTREFGIDFLLQEDKEYAYDRLSRTPIGEVMRSILQEDGYVAGTI